MDVINRLKTAVTNVLPVGNPITNDFELQSQRASGGPALCWKIYDAINKTTKQEATIFIYEKKWGDRLGNRREREAMVEMVKRGVLQLTKLRHPNILSIVHPLEDSRESLAFATEPLFTSLSNALGYHDNLPSPPPPYLKNFTLFDVETKYGLLQITEGLSFLHKGAHIIHGNLSHECIFINRFGTWKLSGFEHAILNTNSQGEPYYPYREFNQHADPLTQPKLHYLAPEYGLSGCCDVSSDIFSLGVLFYSLYNKGSALNPSIHDWKSYKINASDLRNLRVDRLCEIPAVVREVVKLMLNIDPSLRPDVHQLSKTAYFEDVGVATLSYLDLLVQKDNLQKSHFFKDLVPVVAKLPKRVNLQRVVPSLSREATNKNMVPFILPSIFQVAITTNNEEYQRHIFPVLIPLLKLTEPVQVMLLFLQNMELILQKSSKEDIRNHILSLVSRALEVNVPQIQDLCLRSMTTFASIAESSSIKNTIVPKMLRLALSSAPLGIRVNCLVCVGKIIEHLDRWFVIDDVLPAIMTLQSREPAMLMSVLGIFKMALSHPNLGISKEVLSLKLIPHLFPIAVDNALNLKQFNAYMSVIKEMIDKVETEHRSKLEQLDSVQQEQKSLQRFAQEVTDPQPKSTLRSSASASDSLSFLDTPNTTTTITTTTTKKNKHKQLTLEEKESLAKQQELQLRFQSNPSITPTNPHTTNPHNTNPHTTNPHTTYPTKTQSTPKDLTQSLIENNLSSMKINNKIQNNSANYQPFANQSNQPNYQLSLTNQATHLNYQPSPQSTNHSSHLNYQPTPQSTYQTFSNHSLLTQSSSWMTPSTFNQPTKKLDTSAFDSINTGLATKPTNKNQAMAAMTTNNNSGLATMTTNKLNPNPIPNNPSFNNHFSVQSNQINLNSTNHLKSDFCSKNSSQSYGPANNTIKSNLSFKDIQDLLG